MKMILVPLLAALLLGMNKDDISKITDIKIEDTEDDGEHFTYRNTSSKLVPVTDLPDEIFTDEFKYEDGKTPILYKPTPILYKPIHDSNPKIAEVVNLKGFYTFEVNSQGDCFYESFYHIMKEEGLFTESVKILRTIVSEHLNEKRNKYLNENISEADLEQMHLSAERISKIGEAAKKEYVEDQEITDLGLTYGCLIQIWVTEDKGQGKQLTERLSLGAEDSDCHVNVWHCNAGDPLDEKRDLNHYRPLIPLIKKNCVTPFADDEHQKCASFVKDEKLQALNDSDNALNSDRKLSEYITLANVIQSLAPNFSTIPAYTLSLVLVVASWMTTLELSFENILASCLVFLAIFLCRNNLAVKWIGQTEKNIQEIVVKAKNIEKILMTTFSVVHTIFLKNHSIDYYLHYVIPILAGINEFYEELDHFSLDWMPTWLICLKSSIVLFKNLLKKLNVTDVISILVHFHAFILFLIHAYWLYQNPHETFFAFIFAVSHPFVHFIGRDFIKNIFN